MPKELIPYEKEGSTLFKEGNIKALEFSGRTYQVNVFDPNAQEAYWVFMHLTDQGELADSFCLCSDETGRDHCAHMAASLLKIYNKKIEPLHKRYERSFWRTLCIILEARSQSKANQSKTKALIKNKTKKGAKFLQELFEKTVTPTEENSLKFSDLSESELQEVREGQLTPKLRFELSFWSDLAKSLLGIQENSGFYKVDFQNDEKTGLPLNLNIVTEDLSIDLQLKEKELIELIPFLSEIECPLKVRGGFRDRIQNVSFDQIKGVLNLNPSSFNSSELVGVKIGSWLYQDHVGFFRLDADPNFANPVLPKDQIEQFLDKYYLKLGEGLVNPGIWELKGSLNFTKQGHLVISHYLFEEGDLASLNQPNSETYKFGYWIWMKDKGFFKTFTSKNLPSPKTVKEDKVYAWVLSHQSFLNGQEGYHVHLKSLESTITWHVNERGGLIFQSSLADQFTSSPREYGGLIYVKGQGFFSKASFQEALSIPSGEEIAPLKIPSYIRRNEEELKWVSGFFLKKNPIEKGTLNLEFQNNSLVTVPKVEFFSEYQGLFYHFYEDYLYIEKHGFFHLLDKYFLPAEWRETKVISQQDMPNFFDKMLPKLEPFLKEVDPRLKRPQKLALKFGETLYFDSLSGSLPFEQFLKAFRSGKRFFFSEIGMFDMTEKRFQTLGEMFKKSRFPKLELLDFYKLKALEELDIDLTRLIKSPPLDLTGFKSQLRPYQEVGVKWLWSLYSNQLSGLLCDDMGLGKTHQTMGLMAAVSNTLNRPCRFLVVCPTSVLYHWQEKLEAFLPGIKVSVFHGLKRTLTDFQRDEGILLTSYGILRNEIETIKKYNFDLTIFDEIQLAKNHLSRLWRTLKEVKSTMVLGLTGTPIENQLKELKALFDLTLPNLMPSDADFIRLYVKPIERDENKISKALLKRTIDPFLLRRKKEDVLQDLPEKTEEVSHIDLAPSQYKLYQEVYLNAKTSVIQDLMDDKKLVPYIHIFALLSSLKKICDHPALYLKDIENYKKYHSGKWELFLELLSEALGSEQKVVVFSHFLGMLDIIEMHLKENGIGFASLRGSTPNRREMIERFQKDPECKVFVASLQAGGLGIDLTQASVVIHYDRWWNAARENQATDRVHRIGQTRGVQVFKLVTLKTIEEGINTLIEKKQKRMEEIVGTDEAQVIKNLTREELIELLTEGELETKN